MPVPASAAPMPAKIHPSFTACDALVLLWHASAAAVWAGPSRGLGGLHTSVTLFGTLLRSWSLLFLSDSQLAPSMPAATRKPTPTTTTEQPTNFRTGNG